MSTMGLGWRYRASRVVLLTSLAVCCMNASAGLFEDEEARRAVLDLRQKFEADRKSVV